MDGVATLAVGRVREVWLHGTLEAYSLLLDTNSKRHPRNSMLPCGETQTMSHIVESCPLTKLNGGLSRLHSADEDAVSWLTSYGS